MIDPRLIQALDSSITEKRKKAVLMLAKTGDSEALPHLRRVHQNDADNEIRRLAGKGIAYIEQQTGSADEAGDYDDDSMYADSDESIYEEQSRGESFTFYGSYDDDDETEDEPAESAPQNVSVSESAQRESRALVDQAMDWNLRGNQQRAMRLLQKAFKTNPNLKTDNYAVSVAASIMQTDGPTAVSEIMGGQHKPTSTASSTGDTWGQAFGDLGIYAMVVGVGMFVLMVITVQWLSQASAAFADISVLDLFTGFNALIIIVVSIIVGVVAMITLLIQISIIHSVAVGLLSADGTMVRLTRKFAPVSSVAALIGLGITCVMFYLLLNGGTLPDPANYATDVEYSEALFDANQNIFVPLNSLSLLVNIIVLFVYGKVIGDAYNRGMGMGCSALFLSAIALIIAGCGLSAFLTALTA